jgi:hypothetical protein
MVASVSARKVFPEPGAPVMRATGGLLLKIGVCGSKNTGEVIPRVVVPMSMLVEYSILFI